MPCPAKIIAEVIDLARKNGISAGRDDLTKKVNLVFREGRGKRETDFRRLQHEGRRAEILSLQAQQDDARGIL